jgi:hypothetical protein
LLKFATKLRRIAATEKILIAPLDWGLGHASRLVPVIRNQIAEGHEVHLGCNGAAGAWLKARFPTLPHHTLPGYDITYQPRHDFMRNMRRQAYRIHAVQAQENEVLKSLQKHIGFTQIISDNRYGLWHRDTHNILITHQLFPQASSLLAWILRSYLHRRIARFNACWIPDYENESSSLSGALSHGQHNLQNVHFIGPLSRFDKLTTTVEYYEKVIMLSCPEPMRTAWENHLVEILKKHSSPVALITSGGFDQLPEQKTIGALDVFYRADDTCITELLSKGKYIICNAGYSTLMDMHALGVQPAVFATPGQTEQEYLMRYLSAKNKVGIADHLYHLPH